MCRDASEFAEVNAHRVAALNRHRHHTRSGRDELAGGDAVAECTQLVDEPCQRDTRIAEHIRTASRGHFLFVSIGRYRMSDQIPRAPIRLRWCAKDEPIGAGCVSDE